MYRYLCLHLCVCVYVCVSVSHVHTIYMYLFTCVSHAGTSRVDSLALMIEKVLSTRFLGGDLTLATSIQVIIIIISNQAQVSCI